MNKLLIAVLACGSLFAGGAEVSDTVHDSDLQTQQTDPTKEQTVEKHCRRGPRGHRGHKGHKGHKGKKGKQGPQGKAGTSEYGEAYLNIPGGVELIPTTLAPVDFNVQGPLSSNVQFNPLNGIFTVNVPGTYTIEYALKGSATLSFDPPALPFGAITLGVSVNGTPDVISFVPGIFTSTNFEQGTRLFAEATNQITRVLSAGDTVQLLVKATPVIPEPVPFYPVYGIPGATGPQEVAYISLEKIG